MGVHIVRISNCLPERLTDQLTNERTTNPTIQTKPNQPAVRREDTENLTFLRLAEKFPSVDTLVVQHRANNSTPPVLSLSEINPIHILISPLEDMFKLMLSASACVFLALPFCYSFNHKPCTYLSCPPTCHMLHPSHP
jgi:hypothetical protein